MSVLNATLVKQDVVSVHENYFELFVRKYGEVHGYVSMVVCIFGAISNILNVIVLTRRHMITPTNCILTALAIRDFLTTLTYLVYAVYYFVYTQNRLNGNHSQGWNYFIVLKIIFTSTCHNMAMWFTVFRYILVCHHGIGNRLCSLQRAILTIAIIVIANIFVSIPDIFLYRVVKQTDIGYNFSGYRFIESHLVEKHSFYKSFNSGSTVSL
ncbi:hypothetical protein DPMN_174043 [Dreissena polymorpha]|uniref:G-protein coupled receptors family 1 profile domain-containing protein n=1 Tax=Dreissena polymorpha TaxID=45954 RepID=A0A9D4IG28_DREPO|nr:hypothetical protein DPMN_174043 [Dreissena polymorpha]